MFRMLGKKVELYRYKITYTENEEEVIEYCISDKHKEELEQILSDIECTIEEVDQAGNEWFNGLEFNSYDEALEAFNKGEQVYIQEKTKQELVDNLKLRADLDYISIMLGVEI